MKYGERRMIRVETRKGELFDKKMWKLKFKIICWFMLICSKRSVQYVIIQPIQISLTRFLWIYKIQFYI